MADRKQGAGLSSGSSAAVHKVNSEYFRIFRRISVTRQFLLPLTSIVYFFPTMEATETRNCLVTDILLNIRKYSELFRQR